MSHLAEYLIQGYLIRDTSRMETVRLKQEDKSDARIA